MRREKSAHTLWIKSCIYPLEHETNLLSIDCGFGRMVRN